MHLKYCFIQFLVAPPTAMEIIGESVESNILTSEVSLEIPLSIADGTINMSEAVPTPSGGEPTISSTTGTPPEINEIMLSDQDLSQVL